MSRAKEETKFLLTYKFRAYPSALLEYRMENWLYILCNLYNQAIEERKRAWKKEKKLSRKEKGSNNWEIQRKRVAKVHEKVRNARRDFLHKLSRHLVNNYDYISFENLNVRELVQGSNLAKLILDAGWGTLITFATYKAVMAGASVVRVNPSYTTQDCSVCGFRVPKTLAERLHKCPECGTVMDRDYNASVNILQKGLTYLTGGRVGATRTNACGEGSGGALSEESVSHPSLKQESLCGSSGWGKILYQKLLP